MRVLLQDGYRDGFEMEIPDHLDVIIVPRLSITHDYAEPITSSTPKRHNWDDDALSISYDRYRRTAVTINGQVVYEAIVDLGLTAT